MLTNAKDTTERLQAFKARVAAATEIADLMLAIGLPGCGQSDEQDDIHVEIIRFAGDPLRTLEYRDDPVTIETGDLGAGVETYIDAAIAVGICVGLRLRPEAFGTAVSDEPAEP